MKVLPDHPHLADVLPRRHQPRSPWQSQDKRQDAYDLLTPVYNWFTEGFDTADLQEAKALLQALEG